jgi:hypothetical protein
MHQSPQPHDPQTSLHRVAQLTQPEGIYETMQQHQRAAEMNSLAAGGGMMTNSMQAGPI